MLSLEKGTEATRSPTRALTDEGRLMGREIRWVMIAGLLLAAAWAVGREVQGHREVPVVQMVEAESGASSRIEGAWIASEYLIASGDSHPLRGRIFFLDGDWTVVFFVLGKEDGRPRRASAEGGTYTVTDDVVTFRHEFNFSRGSEVAGIAESPLRMEVNARGSEPEEPTRYSVEGSTLTLFFPSGNRMTFSKSGAADTEG
jgi:hypothetical protein